jgi:hypothetical protein
VLERQHQRIVAAFKARGRRLQPGCSQEQLEKLRRQVQTVLLGRVPEDYLGFLRLMNGLDYNGFSIYGDETHPMMDRPQVKISGMVEANEDFRYSPSYEKYLLFGELPPLLYASDLTGTKFGSFDQTSLGQIETFSSFEQMLDAALTEADIP